MKTFLIFNLLLPVLFKLFPQSKEAFNQQTYKQLTEQIKESLQEEREEDRDNPALIALFFGCAEASYKQNFPEHMHITFTDDIIYNIVRKGLNKSDQVTFMVQDLYRAIVFDIINECEHPEYLADELKKNPQFAEFLPSY